MAQWRQTEMLPDVKSYIVDVIAFKDIDDIVSGTGPQEDRITFHYNSTESLTLIARPEATFGGGSPDLDSASAAEAARAAKNEFETVIRTARSRVRDHASANAEKALRPSEVPGTLLYMALAGLCSTNEALRSGAYTLLGEVESFAKLDPNNRTLKVEGTPRHMHQKGKLADLTVGLLIPSGSTRFAGEISARYAAEAPSLTLDLLKEWTNGFSKGGLQHKIATVLLLLPWFPNLEKFCHPAMSGVDGIKLVREIIRNLISITMSEYAVSASSHVILRGFAELTYCRIYIFCSKSGCGGLWRR